MTKRECLVGSVLLAAGLATALPAAAADGTRSAQAHEHGHGTLNIAVEGQQVLMELEVPGADVVGFEHAAESEAEKKVLALALADLKQPLSLFVLPSAAGCSLVSASVAVHEEREKHDQHKGESHAKHADDSAHGKEEVHSHGHAHGHGEQHESGHNEVHAEYALSCANPGAIDSIRFAYFDRFSGAEELDVNLITANGQRSFEVTRAKPVLGLQGMM